MTHTPIATQIEAWKQTENLWLVKIDLGGTFENPDGTQLRLGFGEHLIDPRIPLTRVAEIRNLVGYVDTDGNSMSAEMFQKKKEELLLNACNREELEAGEYPEFDNLDFEYQYRKFIQTWRPEYTTEIVRSPIQFTKVHEVPKQVNEYIVPKRKVTGDPKDTLFIYSYRDHVCEVLREELSEVYRLDDLNSLEFVKIDGKYLSIECRAAEPFIKNKGDKLTLTLEDCQARFKHVDETFRQILQDWRSSRSSKLKDTSAFYDPLNEIARLSSDAVFALGGRNKRVEQALQTISRRARQLLTTLNEIDKLDKQD